MAEATLTSLGEIKLAGDLAGANDANAPELTEITAGSEGEYALVTTTIDTKGRVTAIAETAGSVIATKVPDATTSTKGLVQIGSNIDVASGVISVADATASSVGVVQIGTGLTVSGGIVSVDTSSLLATTTVAGNVIVPTSGNLDVDGSGNISVPLATTTTLGVVQVPTSGYLDIDGSGNISVPLATASTPGIVSIGSGLSVDGAGEVVVPDATTSTKGVVQVGTGIEVTSGVINAREATNAVTGILSTADTNNLTISSGLMDVGTNIPQKDATNTYTKANVVSLVTLTSATSVTVDASLGNVFTVTLGTNATLGNPSNLVAGGTYTFILKQDATGGRTLAYGGNYKFVDGITPTLSTGASAVDALACVYDGSSLLCSFVPNFL